MEFGGPEAPQEAPRGPSRPLGSAPGELAVFKPGGPSLTTFVVWASEQAFNCQIWRFLIIKHRISETLEYVVAATL